MFKIKNDLKLKSGHIAAIIQNIQAQFFFDAKNVFLLLTDRSIKKRTDREKANLIRTPMRRSGF